MHDLKGFIPKHGGYRNLLTYKKAEIIYDATVNFTRRFLNKYDRTIGQMVQAARSGKQNIAEASMASATSKEAEIKLTNVARASLEELLIDYQDYLRTNKLEQWGKENKLTRRFRQLSNDPDSTYATLQAALEHDDPCICANSIISLIKSTSYLLARQIQALERKFLEEGGLRERMTQARLEQRRKK
jgi:four helix bundle suffix protein